MGKKSILSLAGLVLAGAAVSGCQTSRPASGGPMMSNTPSMMGAANQANTTGTGVAQNQAGQTQNWNNRNSMAGTSVGGTVPAGATNPAATTGVPSYNTSRMGAVDRSYQTPSAASGTTAYPRPGTSQSYTTGATPGYPRTSVAGSSDRMMTSPTAPAYQPTSYGSTTQGSSIQSGTTKPATSTPPAPTPVSATSPQFGALPVTSGSSTAPSFTPPTGSMPAPPNFPATDGNQ